MPPRPVLPTFVLLVVGVVNGAPPAPAPPGPVVVVGIDSATWKVIDRLVAAGDLPTFRRLRDGGVSGELHTLVPTYSPTIWTTMVTGVVPTVHGITVAPPASDQPLTSDCRRAPALWEMLEESCLRSNVLNFWCTWPAEPVLGNMVSERYQWRELPRRVSPEVILPLVERTLAGADRPSARRSGTGPAAENEGALLELALELQSRDPAPLLLLYFRDLDLVQHAAWHLWEPEGFDVAESERRERGDEIARAYRRYDAYLGRLVATLPASATIVLVSDHGMESAAAISAYRVLDVNAVLCELGLIVKDASGAVDRARSGAFSSLAPPRSPVSVQLTGRVPAAEVERRLLALTEDGRPLFRLLSSSPTQLLFETPDRMDARAALGGTGKGRTLESFLVGSTGPPGHHADAPPGILVVYGALARGPSIRLHGASVVDIAPTILAMLGVEPPPAMAGSLLVGAVTDDVLARARGLAPRAYERKPPSAEPMPEHVRREVEEELRALGYLN